MKVPFSFLLSLMCLLPSLAISATETKKSSKEIQIPVPTQSMVSAIQAEVEAKKIFCGILGKDCKTDELQSQCAAVEDNKKLLVGFKCSVHGAEASLKTAFDALNVNLNHNLAYISSVKADMPPKFNAAKQIKDRGQGKGGQQ